MLSVLPRSLPGFILLLAFLSAAAILPAPILAAQTGPTNSEAGIAGPFIDPPEAYAHAPAVFEGDLRMAADEPLAKDPAVVLAPLRYVPGESPKPFAPQIAGWQDAVAQTEAGPGAMPAPLGGFAGISNYENYTLQNTQYFPPDTVGDVSTQHYIQMVNIIVAIFDVNTGQPLVRLTLDDFFTGPAGTPCDENHRGDPVVLYDQYVNRWLVSDFAWPDDYSSFYQCLAVSRTSDPVTGGWYFYALRADTGDFGGYLNDYPKLGAWHDGWYLTANMFQIIGGSGFGVRVWALDRQAMINGQPLREVHFDLCRSRECNSLLPAHDNLAQGGLLQPPNYLLAAHLPADLQLWRLDANFSDLSLSTLSAPVSIPVAPFAIAASVPQPTTYQTLDSLSYRLMMPLQYRLRQGIESLWVNHTVATSGVAAVRWYEVQQPGSQSPLLAQQSSYQPDELHRWMGSLAVDQDGNLALGYSVSGEAAYPSIRLAGRLDEEAPSMLPQAEIEVITGQSAQLFTHRWGDYSSMTVAPDGCTFYYTTEYYLTTGSNWQTWIVPFKYPTCGKPKGLLQGSVTNALTGQVMPGVSVTAAGGGQSAFMVTDAQGAFSINLPAGTYSLTAGPLLPGFPVPAVASSVVVLADQTTVQNLALTPYPSLSLLATWLDDSLGNGNQAAEPGESGIELRFELMNNGAAEAQSITGSLSSQTPGVTLQDDQVQYANIPPAQSGLPESAYTFSLDSQAACGAALDFQQVVTDSQQTYTHTLTLDAALNLPRQTLLTNDVEQGERLWKIESDYDTWLIVPLADAPSPAHVWTDSQYGGYRNNTNASLITPAYNLTGKRRVQVSFFTRYALEPGWDYLYLEYSLDGGQSWQPDPLVSLTGFKAAWGQLTVDAPALDGQPNAALRFRLLSDVSVIYDGIYLDDIALTFQPYTCAYPVAQAPAAPVPLSPMADELFFFPSPAEVTFRWLPGPSGAAVDGYRLFLDDVLQVDEIPGNQTQAVLAVPPGEHWWTVQAYNTARGDSPLAAATQFWLPYIYRFPIIGK